MLISTSGDVDGDGLPDLLMATSNGLSILRNVSTTLTPVITSISPSTGPIGSTVTLTGSNFNLTSSFNSVKFNGAPAAVVSSTTTTITVIVPKAATTGPISVANLNHLGISASDFTVIPSITMVSPSGGGVGTAVKISGTSFNATAANNSVKFNGTLATVISSADSTISTTVPIGATTGSITVEVAGQPIVTSPTIFTVRQGQTITFGSITDKTSGDAPFTLSATASSSLNVQYSSMSTKVTLAGNQVTLLKAGSVTIQADQPGDSLFLAAPSLSQTFCINPVQPTIFLILGNGEINSVLSSNSPSGNQWYLNEAALEGANAQILVAQAIGVYTVKVTADNCVSPASDSKTIIITGLSKEAEDDLVIYPVPATGNELYISLQGFQNSTPVKVCIYDVTGKEQNTVSSLGGQIIQLDIRSNAQGLYFVRALQGGKIITRKFIKN
jgi:hypothetical protein